MFNNLSRIVNRDETAAGRVFTLAIQALIVLSIVSFSLETLPNLSDFWQQVLQAFEVFSVAVFTIEYVLRVSFAERKLAFIFSFYGLIDLLAILPFYVTAIL
ncbi:ion transporter [Romeria aff. gracilis LEGE 07310]|uniref:Ion transporter n=1 Tax=Vasconcelosia minhoensis LEGE 07310 TaxID=915328 RepID=A0A8J7A9X6_9CYAN|nr:ion transporter [Romeria gracilis]MBE9076751.1 ion transporter [Romeria aff. gracilis LEGE 07310]